MLRVRGRRATSDASETEGLVDGRWLSPQLVGDGRAAYSAAEGLVEARWLSPQLLGARGAEVPLEGLGDFRGTWACGTW